MRSIRRSTRGRGTRRASADYRPPITSCRRRLACTRSIWGVDGSLASRQVQPESHARVDTKPIRVLLVDDHQLLTGSLAALLAREPDIAVVGVAASVAEAKSLSRERLDVVLMDYRLPDGTGAEATRAIKARWPAARVVMLTAVNDDETILESIQAGRRRLPHEGPRGRGRRRAPCRAAHAGETLLPRSVIVGIAQRVVAARDKGTTGGRSSRSRRASSKC